MMSNITYHYCGGVTLTVVLSEIRKSTDERACIGKETTEVNISLTRE
jgi:hypothetical protein